MTVDPIPTMIEQYRETFEGEVKKGWCWITDGKPDSGVFGTIASLSLAEAFAAPAPGAKSVAAHVAHLRFSLELLLKRLHGENPPADWPKSFDVPPALDPAWRDLQQGLRQAYDGVLAFLESERAKPVQDWPGIQLVGLVATVAHNAYHLGAIRQIAQVVKKA